jgi:hypothetical protein
MIPGSRPGGCFFGKPVSTFPDHALAALFSATFYAYIP